LPQLEDPSLKVRARAKQVSEQSIAVGALNKIKGCIEQSSVLNLDIAKMPKGKAEGS
jgi:hypothetical protein